MGFLSVFTLFCFLFFLTKTDLFSNLFFQKGQNEMEFSNPSIKKNSFRVHSELLKLFLDSSKSLILLVLKTGNVSTSKGKGRMKRMKRKRKGKRQKEQLEMFRLQQEEEKKKEPKELKKK